MYGVEYVPNTRYSFDEATNNQLEVWRWAKACGTLTTTTIPFNINRLVW